MIHKSLPIEEPVSKIKGEPVLKSKLQHVQVGRGEETLLNVGNSMALHVFNTETQEETVGVGCQLNTQLKREFN